MTKKGILLINLGTPNNADQKSVYYYLREFLNDARVIDLPTWVRWLLINLLVIPFRYKKSTKAYQKIWTEQGSPLLVNSNRLKQALAFELGEGYQVEIGMRYGKPSIQSALDNLKACHEIKVIPLFPQYSSAATGSAIAKVMAILQRRWNIPELYIKRDFYDHPSFITAYAEQIKESIKDKAIDSIIFSYHGLPERHIVKSHCQANCDRVNPCPSITDENAFCYRAQCYKTTALLAKTLNLTPTQYKVAFQSRLGRTPWIKPYTDSLLPELKAQGIKNIAVVCPSFVADCLETLEEINIQIRQQWSELGGGEFTFIPCINHHPTWIKGLADMIQSDTLKD